MVKQDGRNPALDRLLEKADFPDRREKAVVGAVPDVDDLGRAILGEKVVEERDLAANVDEIDRVDKSGEAFGEARLVRIGVETLDLHAFGDMVVGEQASRGGDADASIGRAANVYVGASLHLACSLTFTASRQRSFRALATGFAVRGETMLKRPTRSNSSAILFSQVRT